MEFTRVSSASENSVDQSEAGGGLTGLESTALEPTRNKQKKKERDENELVGETHFHNNSFELRLVLTQRQTRTRKWAIVKIR